MNSVQDSPGLHARSKIPYGLMSLSDMVNCSVLALFPLGSELKLMELMGKYRLDENPPDLDEPINDFMRKRTEGWLKIVGQIADDFEWKPVFARIELIRERLSGKRGNFTNRMLGVEFRVLSETIHEGLKNQLIYRYPDRKSEVLARWTTDWADVIGKFPAAEADIKAGVDLWALAHSTASVFHFMRVLEHGLRALAEDVGRSFDVQQWQNIIDQIESEVRTLGKTLPAGKEKTERLKFLSEAAKEFSFFKDGWRNHVAHGRGHYDEHQARSIMEHVRAFMTVLSSRLSEKDVG